MGWDGTGWDRVEWNGMEWTKKGRWGGKEEERKEDSTNHLGCFLS